jgi:hypothetical protein
VLSRFDDFPVHQTPEPLAHRATSDPNAYDRYWWNGVDREGRFYFGAALGLYPHQQVMDAHFSILCDGEQHAFHASRLAPHEPSDTAVGPLRLEILEPLRRLRLTIAPNETGIEADLTFASRAPALEEARARMKAGPTTRNLIDMTRFTQFGTWQGFVRADGVETKVERATTYATRDRSWGVRPVGSAAPGRPADLPQVAWLWAPIHFEDEALLLGYFQRSTGERWNADGMRVPVSASPAPYADPGAPGFVHLEALGERLVFRPGTRWIERAEFDYQPKGGTRETLELETVLRFNMNGLGYAHPRFGHGVWQGDLVVEAEHWKEGDLAPGSPFHQHIHNLVRARVGTKRGVGLLEQILLGPHERYGFTGLVDGQRGTPDPGSRAEARS